MGFVEELKIKISKLSHVSGILSFFSQILSVSHTGDEKRDDTAAQRFSAVVLYAVSLGIGSVSILLNIAEGNFRLAWALGLFVLTATFVIGWVRYVKSSLTILSMISMLLITLAIYVLLMHGVSGGYSLFWFFLLPPILVFCMGLRYGTLLFMIFYACLLLVLLSPLDFVLVEDYPLAMRVRILCVIFGIFILACLAELSRFRLRQALLRAISHLEQDALVDPLTGLGNRRDFYSSVAWVSAQALRSDIPFSLAFVDVDHFKTVNDIYGHAVGDAVLQHITQILSDNLRSTDRIFRWGGEEFIILMPETQIDEARHISERLRRKVEAATYHNKKTSINVTISLGLYCGPVGMEIEQQLSQADLNLYEAKHTGRNRVCG